MYSAEEYMLPHFFATDGLETWLRADRHAPLESWMTTDFRTTRDQIFAEKGYRGPTQWYRSRWGPHAVGVEEEARDLASGKIQEKIRCPVLFVKNRHDRIIPQERATAMMTRFCPDGFEYAEVEGSRH